MRFSIKTKKKIKSLINYPKTIFKPKVFCLSMQRSGTTSVGQFLNDHGYYVAGSGDSKMYKWDYYWHIGDFESIFKSFSFRSFSAYQDSPWWAPDFYKILFHKFPKAKFILLYRDSDKWFDSMLKHSNGNTLGNTKRHCKIYRRMNEFYNESEKNPAINSKFHIGIDNMMSLEGMRSHYKSIYEEHTKEVIDYFNQFNTKALFVGKLEDLGVWQEVGNFLGINVDPDYRAHANKSKKR